MFRLFLIFSIFHFFDIFCMVLGPQDLKYRFPPGQSSILTNICQNPMENMVFWKFREICFFYVLFERSYSIARRIPPAQSCFLFVCSLVNVFGPSCSYRFRGCFFNAFFDWFLVDFFPPKIDQNPLKFDARRHLILSFKFYSIFSRFFIDFCIPGTPKIIKIHWFL